MIFSDSAENFFVGDLKYGNYDINSPSSNFLVGESILFFQSLAEDLFESGAGEIGVLEEVVMASEIETWNSFSLKTLIKFKLFGFPAVSPVNANSYTFKKAILAGSSQLSLNFSALDLNNGQAQISKSLDFGISDNVEKINWLATLNKDSLALLLFESKVGGNNMEFFYAGRTNPTNPLNDYYTASTASNAILLHCSTENGGFPQVNSKHYISSTQKPLLQQGAAIFPIVCENNVVPNSQWSTDMVVFDNNEPLGFPAIGKLPNLLLATGTYEYLKPIKLITAPDAGSNVWVPVGTFANKTLLMRSYSSL